VAIGDDASVRSSYWFPGWLVTPRQYGNRNRFQCRLFKSGR
jgi:hypothetical protein